MPDPGTGYSSTGLATKLGVKPGHDLLLVGAPDGWTVPDLPAPVTARRVRRAPTSGSFDVVVAFIARAAALRSVPALGRLVFPAGGLWIAWPRKAAGHASDVTENAVREVALPVGLVDNKVAALGHDWSALRLVWRKELR